MPCGRGDIMTTNVKIIASGWLLIGVYLAKNAADKVVDYQRKVYEGHIKFK
jgi:hypothetical protein